MFWRLWEYLGEVKKRVLCRSEKLLRDKTRVANSLENSPISEVFIDNLTLDNNKYYTEQTTEGIQVIYMEMLVRRAMKRVPGPISCLRLPGTLQQRGLRAEVTCAKLKIKILLPSRSKERILLK